MTKEYYIFMLKDGLKCPDKTLRILEGFTDNKFIFMQYVKQITVGFPTLKYELYEESDVSKDDMCEKYNLSFAQEIRPYRSKDDSVTIYLNSVFMFEYLCDDSSDTTQYVLTGKSDADKIQQLFLQSTIQLAKLAIVIRSDWRETLDDGLFLLMSYAIKSFRKHPDECFFDTIKLIALANKFPTDM